VLVPLPLFVGLYLLRANRIAVSAGPGWVPAVLAGLLILVVTFWARGRIDTYGGI
jgi:K+ transporter